MQWKLGTMLGNTQTIKEMVWDALFSLILMVAAVIQLLKEHSKIIYYKATGEWYSMTEAIIKECSKITWCMAKEHSTK